MNAAGVFVKEKKLTADGIELTFATNYLAYFLLTHELLPLLESSAPARVVNLASKYGRTRIDFEDLHKLRTPYSYLKSTPRRCWRECCSLKSWRTASTEQVSS